MTRSVEPGPRETMTEKGSMLSALRTDASLHVEEMLAEVRVEQRVVALRTERGISQGELARILGVSQPAAAKPESGRVKAVGAARQAGASWR